MSANLKKVPGEEFLYQHVKNDQFYLRQRTEDRDTDLCLETTNIKMARKIRDLWKNQLMNQRLGIVGAPKKQKRLRVTAALDIFKKAGFPITKRRRFKRPGEKHARTHEDAVVLLKKFFRRHFVDDLCQKLLDKYHTWRVKHCKGNGEGKGDRTTDLELNTLSLALDWAVRQQLIDSNPIYRRDHYHSYVDARHCKELSPSDAVELHLVGAELFKDPRSASSAWQLLFEANFGTRTEETLRLKRNAGPGEPGFLQGDSMTVRRAKKAGRENPTALIHEEGRVLLNALYAWHDLVYPDSPWLFPGKGGKRPLTNGALTKRLEILRQAGRLKRKLTSHGGRAYFVTHERSWGVPDEKTAWRISQIGGVDTLRISYGNPPPEWMDGKGPKLTFLPPDKKDYAWAALFKQLGFDELGNKIVDKSGDKIVVAAPPPSA